MRQVSEGMVIRTSGGLVVIVVAYVIGIVVGGGWFSGLAFDRGFHAGHDFDAQRRLLCERCGRP